MSESEVVSKGPCKVCNSSDANARYDDGHEYCYSCKTYTGQTSDKEGERVIKPATRKTFGDLPPLPSVASPMRDRNITADTVKKYGVTVSDEGSAKHVYPYYDMDDQYIAVKERGHTKKFRWKGDTQRYSKAGVLFGQQLFAAGSAKSITITEGELDAMSAFQMQGSKYPCVSVTSAGSAFKDCLRSFDYLNSFEDIRLVFDKDEPKLDASGNTRYVGQEAALAVAKLFPGKVRIVTLKEGKDSSDYLIEDKASTFMREWWAAPLYTPAGLVSGKDMWEKVKEPKANDSIPYPWDTWNDKTYGMRKSEMVTVTADTGVGKTSVFKEIEHHILRTAGEDVGIGLLHLEEPNEDTALGLLSITANKPLHLPDVRETVDAKELRGYFDETLDNDRVIMWDHFGSNTIDEVVANIRFMANMGCEYIFLDHLSILVSDQSGDERKQLDEAATKLKTLCMELKIHLCQVIHTNRKGEIRGTAGVEQLSNLVIKLTRDKKSKDEFIRNVTTVEVDKNRFCGRTGPCGYLHFTSDTGRLSELDEASAKRFEEGQAPEDFNFNEKWEET